MTLKWRQKKQGWSRSSASIPMPAQVQHQLHPASPQFCIGNSLPVTRQAVSFA